MRMNRRVMMQQALIAMAFATRVRAQDVLFDAQGYRQARYRAVVDRPPDPARRIALADALALGPDALFVDVMPAEGAVRDPQTGRWRLAEPHLSIPGAVWFPETGRAPVDPVLWRALASRVSESGRGTVVMFCRADCWMSWNAARRLSLEDHAGIRWLAEGIDGWHDAGRALVSVIPESD